jgi:hypothetical protein
MGGSSPAYPAEVQGGLPGHLAHPHQVGDPHPHPQTDKLLGPVGAAT